MADAVDALLDRSVGAEEYVIRAAAEGVDPDPLVDLSARSTSRRLPPGSPVASVPRPSGSRALLRVRAVTAARQNPTRHELVERIEELIAEYNAGSLNIDEYLRRLIALSHRPLRRGAAGRRART